MKTTLLILATVAVLSVSCQQDDSLIEFAEFHESVDGSWLLVEKGYSPGAGYVTTPVPSEPAQVITFLPDSTIHSNIKGLEKFKYYEVWEDSVLALTVLSLYEQQPSGVSDRPAASSYTVIFNNQMLKLSFRWCIEGCHMGLRAIERPQNE